MSGAAVAPEGQDRMADVGTPNEVGTASRRSRGGWRPLSFADWSLRSKMAALLGLASLLPLAIATFLDIHAGRRHMLATTEALLGARAEQLTDRLDAFDLAHRRSAERLAGMPVVRAVCRAHDGGTPPGEHTAWAAQAMLDTWPLDEEALNAISVLDRAGVVVMTTDPRLRGLNLSSSPFVREALAGQRTAVSDLFRPSFLPEELPLLAYTSPTRGKDGGVTGAVVLWVRAEALWSVARAANALAGTNSFALLTDQYGIRIAHSVREWMLFHPTGPLPPAVSSTLIAGQRFGRTTGGLLGDVRSFPELFKHARSPAPDRSMFRDYAPGGRAWSYGVARRMSLAPWTLFYLVPEETVEAQMAAMTLTRLELALAVLVVALALGALFARGIARPVQALSRAMAKLAAGDRGARAPASDRLDEVGALGIGFNTMAARLQQQAEALEEARAELAVRVEARTAELNEATRARERIQARLTALYDAGIIGIIVATLGGRVLEINDALLAMLGFTGEEIVSGAVPWRSLTPAEWQEPDQRAIAALRATGSAPLREKEYLHKNGTRVPVLVGSALLPGPRGEAISFVLDVSANRQAATAIEHLREARVSERRFRGLLEAAPDAMVIVDGHGRILLVNEQVERMFGYTRAELLGERADKLLPEHAAWIEAQRLSRSPARADGDRNERRRDGSAFPVEVTLAPLETEQGPVVVAAVRDISERKRADEQRLRLAALVESSADAIISKTLEGTITSWNDAARDLFGYQRSEIVGKSIWLLIPPEGAAEEHEILNALARGERIEQRDTVRLRKDGRRVEVQVTSSPMRDSQGRITGASKILRDITERRRAERALAQARDATQVAYRELESFSYSVAHDLRAPLRAMNGFARLLLERYQTDLDEEGADWLHEIVTNAGKMGELIDALLSLARLTRGELRRDHVDLSAIAREVVQQLAATEPGHTVTVRISDGLRVDADARLVRALLVNLLGNAWKFSARTAAPEIELSARQQDGQRVFFVRDNGAGFDMAFAQKLFVPLQRLHSVAEFPGTGIGLATAQRIVHRHGGRIWAEGQVDGGATFSFTLPPQSPEETA